MQRLSRAEAAARVLKNMRYVSLAGVLARVRVDSAVTQQDTGAAVAPVMQKPIKKIRTRSAAA